MRHHIRGFLAGVLASGALLAGGVLATTAQPISYSRTIYVHDTSQLSNAAILDALPAFQAAVDKDFAPIWHENAKLVYVGSGPVPAGGWRIDIVQEVAGCFCYGYHDVNGDTPFAKVGHDDWQITFTHELFEMLADPYVDRAAEANGTTYVVESADPVEADRFAYTRKSRSGKPVRISDFVTPAWFRPAGRGRYDFRGYVKHSLQILVDGYQLIWLNGSLSELRPSPDRKDSFAS